MSKSSSKSFLTKKELISMDDCFYAYTLQQRDTSLDLSERQYPGGRNTPFLENGEAERWEMDALRAQINFWTGAHEYGDSPLGVEAALGDQAPSLGLTVYPVLFSDPTSTDRTLLVALFNGLLHTSNLNPGANRYASNDKVGYYLEKVRVDISNKEKYAFSFEEPKAKNNDGNTTSSFSLNLDLGAEPTVSTEYSNSRTVNYKELNLEDHSDPVTGSLTHEWSSILDYNPESGTSGLFDGAHLASPPSSLNSDFPLIDQVAWKIPPEAQSANVVVTVSMVLTACEGIKAITVDYAYSRLTIGWTRKLTLKW